MTFRPHTGHQALRRGRTSVAGGWYLLTTVTDRRTPWFADADAADLVAHAHCDPRLFAGARCLAWVLMPDHWHGVVELGGETDLAGVMNRFKSTTAALLNRKLGRYGAIWSKAYHDRMLRDTDDIVAALEYVSMNPVRAGLCADPHDYVRGCFPT